jgi:hypothetical protein
MLHLLAPFSFGVIPVETGIHDILSDVWQTASGLQHKQPNGFYAFQHTQPSSSFPVPFI